MNFKTKNNKKLLGSLILFLFFFIGKSQSVFDILKYDKVVVYDYDGKNGENIVSQGILNEKLIYSEMELNNSYIKKVNKIISNKKSYGDNMSKDFKPSMGIVYYKQDKIIGYISICLKSNCLKSLPKISIQDSNKNAGLTKLGRKQINDVCRELEFRACLNDTEANNLQLIK